MQPEETYEVTRRRFEQIERRVGEEKLRMNKGKVTKAGNQQGDFLKEAIKVDSTQGDRTYTGVKSAVI